MKTKQEYFVSHCKRFRDNMFPTYLVLLFGVICNKLVNSSEIPQNGSIYTDREIELLQEFRERVQEGFTQSYMTENNYLIRFLRASKLDLAAAEEMMKSNFAWRKLYQADAAINEDWSHWESMFPIYVTDNDHQGTPMMLCRVGTLNLQRIFVSRKLGELRRYLIYVIDSVLQYQSQMFIQNGTGDGSLGGHIIVNAAGLNLQKFTCVGCIQALIELLHSYEKYYPQYAKRIIAINTPKLVERFTQYKNLVLQAVTRNKVEVYGFNKQEWIEVLLKSYSKEQLLPDFGGTGTAVTLVSKLRHLSKI